MARFVKNVAVKLSEDQFEQVDSRKRWLSGRVEFDQGGMPKAGDEVLIRLRFEDKGQIQVTDSGFFSSSEGIYFKVFPKDPVFTGGSNALPWEWRFKNGKSDAEAEAPRGTGVVNENGLGLINADSVLERVFDDVELTNGSFIFTGIDLRLEVNKTWIGIPIAAEFGVEADELSF